MTIFAGREIHSTYGYSIGGFNDIDLLTDSLGIWAVYTNTEAGGNILIAKLDSFTLKREFVYLTKASQSDLMNCFMVRQLYRSCNK